MYRQTRPVCACGGILFTSVLLKARLVCACAIHAPYFLPSHRPGRPQPQLKIPTLDWLHVSFTVADGFLSLSFSYLLSQQRGGERSKGKGRRVCLVGRIFSIPNRASCFASVDLDVFNLFIQITRGKIASAARKCINSSPQTDATTFALASVSIFLLCSYHSREVDVYLLAVLSVNTVVVIKKTILLSFCFSYTVY